MYSFVYFLRSCLEVGRLDPGLRREIGVLGDVGGDWSFAFAIDLGTFRPPQDEAGGCVRATSVEGERMCGYTMFNPRPNGY